jgi:hypothetical protein
MTCCEPLCHLDHIEESVRLICDFKIIKNSNFEQLVSEAGLFKITSRERWFISKQQQSHSLMSKESAVHCCYQWFQKFETHRSLHIWRKCNEIYRGILVSQS